MMQKYLTITLYGFVFTFLSFELFTIRAQANSKFNYEFNNILNNSTLNKNIKPYFKNDILLSNTKDTSFKELRELKKIKKDHSVGKLDPFSIDGDVLIQKDIELISLSGIISNGFDHYALIKYKDKVGKLSIGEIGGETTSLLPNDVKLIKILVDQSQIIIRYKSEKYTLSMY